MSFDKLLEDIERQLQEDQQTLRELEGQTGRMRDRVQRLVQAKRALEGASKKSTKKQPGPANPDWKPNAQSIQAIMTTLSEADGPLSIKEIEAQAGWSHSHTDSTVRYLRQHEMIRLAGKRGTAYVYAPMINDGTGLKETEEPSAAYAA